ncbi:MBL fold metallo-hydrolase [Algoriphagus sp.]|uniref:MBL fold metallo-hydrolase n=1 Tax=Algoriphagus sp. TaxID=1872435 RepID=UPI0025F7DC0B|nr:MBL fold metallo-hydrolase [Algoriphagus sp.]
MKKLILLFFLISNFSIAQDLIPTSTGDEIKVTPILHGTVVLEYQGKTIYVDPYGGASLFNGQKKPDMVLITDIHGDHHNQETLDGLDLSNAIIIAPQAVAEKLPEGSGKSVQLMSNGQKEMISGISISAIPMYNLPETDDSRHPKGRGNGYIVELGGKKIYLSGDTEDIPEMRSLSDIDVAFVCMNLPYTMDVDQAADAVADFKPGIVYPYHFRGGDGLADVEKFKSSVNSKAPEVEVRLRNWYPEN